MKIVPLTEIPKLEDITDVPLDNVAKVYKVCLEMEQVCEREGGIGLSAVQVGIPWRLFIAKRSAKSEYEYYVNCDYQPTDDAQQIVSLEGCLSIRSDEGQLQHFEVSRFTRIKVLGRRLLYNRFLDIDDLFEMPFAVVLQHEIDHHKGILISELGKEVFIW